MEGMLVSLPKLKHLAKQARHLNIFPIFLDHYLPRNEKNPVSSLFADLVEECTSALRQVSEEELSSLLTLLPSGLRMLVPPRDPTDVADTYLHRVATYYIISRVQALYISFPEVLAASQAESALLGQYPALREKFDKEGLLVLDDDLIPYDGGLEYEDHIIQYHQFLRRGFTSNPNFDFLGRFVEYYRGSGHTNRFAVAVDHTRLMPKEFFLRLAEFDRWFGPAFDADRLDDPLNVGLTIHLRTRPSIFDLTNRIDRTEFFWRHKTGVKTLEIEEISAPDYSFGPYVINRYVHSERDIAARVVRHFDGAAKVYLADQYPARADTNIPHEPRAFRKVKLFRIDGDIETSVWLDLVAHFYKANEMIIEYFDPETFEREFGDRIRAHRGT